MLESNPPPGDVKLWMPGTYLWLADHIDSPYLEGSRIGNWWGLSIAIFTYIPPLITPANPKTSSGVNSTHFTRKASNFCIHTLSSCCLVPPSYVLPLQVAFAFLFSLHHCKSSKVAFFKLTPMVA
jgi:hypothetical protein